MFQTKRADTIHTFGGTYARVGHAVDGVDLAPSTWTQWTVLTHCQGGRLLSGLQRARTAGLVGRYLGEGDAGSWLHVSHARK